MKLSVTIGLIWFAACQAALACENIGNPDAWQLEQRAPVQVGARNFVIRVLRREIRGNRSWVVEQSAVEYEVPLGTPVIVVHGGRIESARLYPDHGKAVVVDHGANVRTVYGRLDSFNVSEGECVAAGTIIGRTGAAGGSEPTLHYEVSADGHFIWPILPLARLGGHAQ